MGDEDGDNLLWKVCYSHVDKDDEEGYDLGKGESGVDASKTPTTLGGTISYA